MQHSREYLDQIDGAEKNNDSDLPRFIWPQADDKYIGKSISKKETEQDIKDKSDDSDDKSYDSDDKSVSNPDEELNALSSSSDKKISLVIKKKE